MNFRQTNFITPQASTGTLGGVRNCLSITNRVCRVGRRARKQIGFVRSWGSVMNMAGTRGWHSRLQSNRWCTLFFCPDRRGIKYLEATVLSFNHTPLVCDPGCFVKCLDVFIQCVCQCMWVCVWFNVYGCFWLVKTLQSVWVCSWLLLGIDAAIGNQVSLAWTRVSTHQDADSNQPLLFHPLIPRFLSQLNCLNLTLTGAPDKKHYTVNDIICLHPPPFLLLSSISIFFLTYPCSDVSGSSKLPL